MWGNSTLKLSRKNMSPIQCDPTLSSMVKHSKTASKKKTNFRPLALLALLSVCWVQGGRLSGWRRKGSFSWRHLDALEVAYWRILKVERRPKWGPIPWFQYVNICWQIYRIWWSLVPSFLGNLFLFLRLLSQRVQSRYPISHVLGAFCS